MWTLTDNTILQQLHAEAHATCNDYMRTMGWNVYTFIPITPLCIQDKHEESLIYSLFSRAYAERIQTTNLLTMR